MIVDQTITRAIDKELIADNEKRDKAHKSSGKLSASMLGYPIQWQILKSLKAPKAPFDAYTLRKFLRGTTIEDWFVKHTPGVVDTQKFVEYRDTVGYIDILVDHKDYEFKEGLVVHEVKSATGFKYPRVVKAGKPDDHHALQAAFYAIAEGTDYFAVDYVSADDLRIVTYILETSKYKERIDNIIGLYQETKKSGEIPVFKPMMPWQAIKKYNSYPDWAELNEAEIKEKAIRLKL